MSLSGKTAASSSCLSSQCFDLLTRSCVKCSDLFKDNTSKGTRVAGTKLPGTGWLWAGGAGDTPGVGGGGDLLLQIVMEMVDRALSSPGGGAGAETRGQLVLVRGTWCREKSDDPDACRGHSLSHG